MPRYLTILLAAAIPCFAQDLALPALKAVKGAPFSAEAVTESTQVLPDGNRIVRTTSASIARDSEGRPRREQRLPTGSIVFLQDPTSDEHYILDSRTRLARKLRAPKPDTAAASPAPTNFPLGVEVVEGVLTEGTRLIRTI